MKPRLWAGKESPLEYARPGPRSEWRASAGRIFHLRKGRFLLGQQPAGLLERVLNWTKNLAGPSNREGYTRYIL